MSALKIPNFLKCSLQRASCSSIHLQATRPFTKCSPNLCKDAPAFESHEAGQFFANLIRTRCERGSLFAGTGQYYQVPDHECVVLLNFEEDFIASPEATLFDAHQLLDINVPSKQVDLLKTYIANSSPYPLYRGELDSIDVSQWQYGFIVKPFSIFSGDERVCLFVAGDEGDAMGTIHTSEHGVVDVLAVSSVEYVGLFVSAEPYNERRLVLGMRAVSNDDDVLVATGTDERRQVNVKTLLSVQKNDVSCDLGKLTIETEWLMKAAALLCQRIQQLGNRRCQMQVSPVLLPENNPYVEMRQKKWMELIQKYTDNWFERFFLLANPRFLMKIGTYKINNSTWYCEDILLANSNFCLKIYIGKKWIEPQFINLKIISLLYWSKMKFTGMFCRSPPGDFVHQSFLNNVSCWLGYVRFWWFVNVSIWLS